MPFFPLEADDKVRDYFETLPAYLQENIMQAGFTGSSVEELRSYAENMLKGQNML